MALLALFLSSGSLLVIQSIMTGLQGSMIKKYKNIYGDLYLEISKDTKPADLAKVKEKLRQSDLVFVPETEIELLAKHKGQVTPVVLHGVDYQQQVPDLLKDLDRGDIILGVDLASKLKASVYDSISFYSPRYTNDLFGEVPRFVSGKVSDLLYTGFFEIDVVNAWVRKSLVSNLTRNNRVNLIRIYNSKMSKPDLEELVQGEPVRVRSWDDDNRELLWAFKLETTVMVSLFICMSGLVALTIVSGVLIFFSKIKFDLVSFWILGYSKDKIKKLMIRFFNLGSLLTCILGVLFGTGLLLFLKYFSPDIMPEVFMERSLPVDFNWKYYILALIIPYSISSFFCIISLKSIFNDHSNFVSNLRKMGS
jgi:lipoprotein-releasing system permease protein